MEYIWIRPEEVRMNQILQMLSGAAQQAILHPLQGGIEAWLVTTALIFVVMPGLMGILISMIGKPPKELAFGNLLSFWIKWCVFGPITLAWHIIRFIGSAVVRYFFPERRQSNNRQRVHNTYNFSFTLFGGDRNNGQNQRGQRRRRQRNRNP
ncbi:MAG: hypothetical protein D6724_09380 [Armatimonadetes bacterium]|nr:MAG: hypothetical protein D6724_09380 [Armatimonadota bacterium]